MTFLKKAKVKAFTLVEMLVVLLIISVLLLLFVPNLTKQKEAVNDKGKAAVVKVVESQAELYSLDKNEEVSLSKLQADGRITEEQAKAYKEYTKKIEDCSIEVTIYKLKESKKSSCVAKFKYDNIEYLLTGTMKQQEFEKILNNLFFPK